MTWFFRAGLIAAGLALYPLISYAVTSEIYWLGGTSSTGAPIFIPVTSVNPLPTSCH
jgi:hypothetical protein